MPEIFRLTGNVSKKSRDGCSDTKCSCFMRRFTTLRQNKKLTTSYVWGPNEIPLLQLTLGQLLQKAADSYGDETSVVFVHQNVRKTFHQLLQEVNKNVTSLVRLLFGLNVRYMMKVDQVAAGLLSLGLNPGDRLGIWGPNSYEWLLTQWAAARAGLILVLLFYRCITISMLT